MIVNADLILTQWVSITPALTNDLVLVRVDAPKRAAQHDVRTGTSQHSSSHICPTWGAIIHRGLLLLN